MRIKLSLPVFLLRVLPLFSLSQPSDALPTNSVARDTPRQVDVWNNRTLSKIVSDMVMERANGSKNDEFCSLDQMRSHILRDRVYIDGGILTMRRNGTEKNAENATYELNNKIVFSVGLGEDFPWDDIPVDGIIKLAFVPHANGGVILPAGNSSEPQDKFYIYGGKMSYDYQAYRTDPALYRDPSEIYLFLAGNYSTPAEGAWSEDFGRGDDIVPMIGGAHTYDPIEQTSYYLGGYPSNDISRLPQFVGGLVKFRDRIWKNITTPIEQINQKGFLEYLPYGKRGVLISFGGMKANIGAPSLGGSLAPMDEINIYDIASDTWYTHAATGTLPFGIPFDFEQELYPKPRVRSCSAVFPAPDHSSFNIYVYGGDSKFVDGETDGTPFGDVWVLSIPSFAWVKLDRNSYNRGISGHNCHAYGKYLISVGGREYYNNRPDRPCTNILTAFDASEARWVDYRGTLNGYKAKSSYTIPKKLIPVIGGNAYGSAFQADIFPQDSPLHNIFSTVIDTTWKPPIDYPDHNNPLRNNSTLVAGLVVGCVLGGLLLLTVIYFGFRYCFRRELAHRLVEKVSGEHGDGKYKFLTKIFDKVLTEPAAAELYARQRRAQQVQQNELTLPPPGRRRIRVPLFMTKAWFKISGLWKPSVTLDVHKDETTGEWIYHLKRERKLFPSRDRDGTKTSEDGLWGWWNRSRFGGMKKEIEWVGSPQAPVPRIRWTWGAAKPSKKTQDNDSERSPKHGPSSKDSRECRDHSIQGSLREPELVADQDVLENNNDYVPNADVQADADPQQQRDECLEMVPPQTPDESQEELERPVVKKNVEENAPS